MRTICPLNIQGCDAEEYLCSEEAAFANMQNMLKGGKKGKCLVAGEILKENDLLPIC